MFIVTDLATLRSLFCLFLIGGLRQVLLYLFLFKAGMGVLVFLFFQQPHEVDMEVPGKGNIWATFFMLNSTEHEIYPAHKYENANNCCHFNIY